MYGKEKVLFFNFYLCSDRMKLRLTDRMNARFTEIIFCKDYRDKTEVSDPPAVEDLISYN